MKRIGNIYEKIFSIDNLLLADKIARRGKSKQPGIIEFDKNHDQNIADLYRELITNTYKISEYRLFKIYEPKERDIACLPYRDRVVQHAVMIPLEQMFVANLTADTYSCIKGRGVHAAGEAIKRALKDIPNTTYCLKLDIRKFYPSVDHDILKQLLRRKIKDKELLGLLDGIIESAPGIPIGNLLSQHFSNLYLSPLDHWIKEKMCVRRYFRYADDIVILSDSKDYLHKLRVAIAAYLKQTLKLELKRNYQVFPVKDRGIDVLGYVYFHTHTLLRKSNKRSFARAVKAKKSRESIASHRGWAKHANTKHLIKKLYGKKVY